MKKVLYLVPVCCLALLSCKSNKANQDQVVAVEEETITVTTAPDSIPLPPSQLNGEWDVIELNNIPVSQNEFGGPFIGFNVEENKVFGNSGCNMMTGVLVLDSLGGTAMSFEQIASTRRACPNDTIEQVLLSAINNIESYSVINCDSTVCEISLYDVDKTPVITLQKRAATPAPAAKKQK